MKENKVAEIKEKLIKEEAKLENLLKQKKTIDTKIANVKAEIERCNNIINQQAFNELSDVLSVKGITLDDIMSAIKNNNLASLDTLVSANANDNNTNKEYNVN